MSRVTSVELDEEDARYIEDLIREGRVRSLKEFVEKCVKFGRKYTLDRWQPGVFNVGPVRMVMIPKKVLEFLFSKLSERDCEDVGQEMGEILRSLFFLYYRINPEDNVSLALKAMSENGMGEFILDNGGFIQVFHSALPPRFIKAYLETTLSTKLENIELKIDVQLFRIVDWERFSKRIYTSL